jgi:hypothetical protein
VAAASCTRATTLFTLPAQAGELARPGNSTAPARPGAAAAAALALLAPWLPSFFAQARRVKEEYLIPPASGDTLLGRLRWATGLPGGVVAWLALLA